MTKRILLYVMAAFYIFAGVNHFRVPEFYRQIMPPFLPWHLELVLLSGIAEIVCGIGLLIPRTRKLAAWATIALLIAVFPANIQMALHDPFDTPEWALWLRLPLQGVLIAWAYWYTRPETARLTSG